MFRSFHTQLVTKIASATLLLAVTFACGLVAISMSGVSEVKAEPEPTAIASLRQGRPLAGSGPGNGVFVPRVAALRAELSIRHEATGQRPEHGQGDQPSIVSVGITEVALSRKRKKAKRRALLDLPWGEAACRQQETPEPDRLPVRARTDRTVDEYCLERCDCDPMREQFCSELDQEALHNLPASVL